MRHNSFKNFRWSRAKPLGEFVDRHTAGTRRAETNTPTGHPEPSTTDKEEIHCDRLQADTPVVPGNTPHRRQKRTQGIDKLERCAERETRSRRWNAEKSASCVPCCEIEPHAQPQQTTAPEQQRPQGRAASATTPATEKHQHPGQEHTKADSAKAVEAKRP